jgi:hypothetical protein
MRVRRSTPILPRIAYACVVSLFVAGARAGGAQSLSVSGSPSQSMTVNSVVSAGLTPKPDSDATTTYTVRTTGSAGPKKITARLTSAMPAGTSLTIRLSAVTGSVGVGTVTLTTTAQTVLNNITTTFSRTGAITYALNATLAAGVVSSRSRFVIFTLADYP